MKTTIAKRGDDAYVRIAGDLGDGESAPWRALRAKLPRGHITFDVSGIKALNSRAFRAWIAFLKDLDRSSSFELVQCGPAIAEYCNLLPETSFATRITSVLVPYRCGACREASDVEIHVAGQDPGKEFPISVCTACNGTIEATIPAATFLEFRLPPET